MEIIEPGCAQNKDFIPKKVVCFCTRAPQAIILITNLFKYSTAIFNSGNCDFVKEVQE